MFKESFPKFLLGGGEAGELIRSIDWSKTELGVPDKWPSCLKTAVKILLDCKLPMHISWGNEFIQIYNDAYRPILGNKHPKAMGISIWETWDEIWPTIGPMFADVKNGNSIGYDDFKLTIERYGYPEDCYFNFSYSPLPDDDGNPAGVLVTFAETTEKVLSEQKIKAEREKLFSILMQAPTGFCVMEGPDHAFTLLNSLWYKLFDTENKKDIIGKSVREAQPELGGQGFYELLDTVYKTGEPYFGKSVPVDFVQPDGSIQKIYLDFVYTPKRNANSEIDGIICVFNDVTERCLAINNLESEQKMREQFVSLLTHDLRNPLSAAKISAQALGRSTLTPEKQTSLSGRIVDSINRANGMIENLLDANRIKAGETLPLKIEESGLISIVSDVLIDLATVHGDRFQLNSKQPLINGYWSHDGILRIVENLCNNAVKFGKGHSPITVTLDQQGEEVILKVHNFGNPIPREEQRKLFDPFQRSRSEDSKPGWGLGLTLVKGLSEAHGGKVEVESEVNTGTTFTITLPKDSRSKMK